MRSSSHVSHSVSADAFIGHISRSVIRNNRNDILQDGENQFMRLSINEHATLFDASGSTLLCTWQILQGLERLHATKVNYKEVGEVGAALGLPIG